MQTDPKIQSDARKRQRTSKEASIAGEEGKGGPVVP